MRPVCQQPHWRIAELKKLPLSLPLLLALRCRAAVCASSQQNILYEYIFSALSLIWAHLTDTFAVSADAAAAAQFPKPIVFQCAACHSDYHSSTGHSVLLLTWGCICVCFCCSFRALSAWLFVCPPVCLSPNRPVCLHMSGVSRVHPLLLQMCSSRPTVSCSLLIIFSCCCCCLFVCLSPHTWLLLSLNQIWWWWRELKPNWRRVDLMKICAHKFALE